ncbi:response regulator [Pseudocnuella soli]|uniref:response regulator n=1 Tax=Pseudocnuella soli TaxID=2502779 RepID=UPI0010533539|nr:response regulator [Pseudocnuella soli]
MSTALFYHLAVAHACLANYNSSIEITTTIFALPYFLTVPYGFTLKNLRRGKMSRPYKAHHFWVDDDLDDLELIREFLKRHAPNHDMIEFADGQKLFDHVKALDRAHHPSLIVLDINMPKHSAGKHC